MLSFLLSIADESHHAKIEYLFNRYHREMLRIARGRLRSEGRPSYEMDAEDVVQNAFVKIVRYIERIDFTKGEKAVRAYLMTTLIREINRFLKDNPSVPDCLDDYTERLEDGDFFGELRISLRYEEVLQAIRSLDERYSVTLTLRYAEDMSVAEIAETMGLNEKCIYARLDKGKRLLIEKLNGGK